MEFTFYNIRHFGWLGIRYAVEKADTPGVYLSSIPIWIAICTLIGIALAAYLLGSINTAVILSRTLYHTDVRHSGSGNAGTTNMMRTYGKRAALFTLLGDISKGVLAYAIGATLLGETGGYIAGLFCIIGHAYPLYFHFKGGKGIATVAGIILCLSPLTFTILLLVFILIVWWTKYISLGSILAMLLFPVLISRLEAQSPFKGVCTVLIALLIVYLHRENIRRLYCGKENKFSFHKKPTVPTPQTEVPAQDASVTEAEDAATTASEDTESES